MTEDINNFKTLTQITEENFNAFEPLIDDRSKRLFFSDETTAGLGVVIDNTACGALIYSYDETVIRIICLSVADDFRRRKVGSFLMDTICRRAYEKAILIVCDFFVEKDYEKDERYLFFSALNGFTVEWADANVYRFNLKYVDNIIKQLPPIEIKTDLHYYFEENKGMRKYVMDCIGMSEKKSNIENNGISDLSFYLVDNHEPIAAVFTREESDSAGKVLELAYLWSTDMRELMSLMVLYLKKLSAYKQEYKNVVFAAVNENSDRMAKHLIGESFIIRRCVSVVWDMDAFPLPYSRE